MDIIDRVLPFEDSDEGFHPGGSPHGIPFSESVDDYIALADRLQSRVKSVQWNEAYSEAFLSQYLCKFICLLFLLCISLPI